MHHKSYGRLIGELERISGIFAEVEAGSFSSLGNTLIAQRLVLSMQNCFEHFVRRVILDSATGRAFDFSGPIYCSLYPPPRTREQACIELLRRLPGRNPFEPDWYKPAKAIDAARILSISNYNKISTVLGVSPWPLDELRIFRNFLAHQSKSSAVGVRALNFASLGGRIDSWSVIFERDAAGIARHSTWMNTIKFIGRQLIQ
jgi:hypothetical protein